jgi:hypothetical protein
MGTYSSLDIGRFEIDWGKNEYFFDHRAIFQENDRKKVTYYYAGDETKIKYAYTKKLGLIKDRLDLLGYSIENLKREYENIITTRYELKGFMSFDKLLFFIKSIDIKELTEKGIDLKKITDSLGSIGITYGLGYLINHSSFSKYIPKYFRKKNFDETSYSYLPMYLLLRLLAENPNNHDLDVIWRIGDVIDSGWVTWNDVRPKVPDDKCVWIVTEGSSDTKILERSIEVIKPHVKDIFKYIDMQDNYPFTGTGQLTNFYKGLVKIHVINKMLFIFDNDTEGMLKFRELNLLKKKPANLLLCHLPNLESFNDFPTIGATGEQTFNINGKAVSIECFLDLNFADSKPMIQWGGYNDKAKQYQGSLIDKDSYTRAFTLKNIKNGKYDLSKITVLLDYLFKHIVDNKT